MKRENDRREASRFSREECARAYRKIKTKVENAVKVTFLEMRFYN